MNQLARTCAALAFGAGYTAADVAAAARELRHVGYRVADVTAGSRTDG